MRSDASSIDSDLAQIGLQEEVKLRGPRGKQHGPRDRCDNSRIISNVAEAEDV
jgi:hypothetical protein